MNAIKILIVEDDPSIAHMLRSSLQHCGYQIPACVATGEQAIQAAGADMPDVVLMDIKLEGKMDGVEAATRIRKDLGIPSIFISGDDDNATIERSQLAEPLVYILKPFSPKKLQIAIETGLHSYQSAQKKAAQSLRAVDLRYRRLVENMNQGIFHIGSTGRFILVNTYFAKMMGFESPDEVLNLAASARRHFVSEDYYQDLLRFLRKEGYVQDFEFQAYRKDGSKIWLSQSVRALSDPGSGRTYFEGFVRDITKRKQLEEERLYLMARQTALLAAIPEIIMQVDSNKTYTWANKAGLEFFGDDVIGRQASDYFEGEQTTYDLVQPLFNGKQDSIYLESWQRRKDGEKRLLAWRCQSLKANGNAVVGALSSARDITDQSLAEQERVRSLTRQVLMNQMQRRLLATRDLTQKLNIITDGIVNIFGADFCRIWLVGPGDLCSLGCAHAAVTEGSNSCRDRDKCLRLTASSGRYTRTNGATHQRIPFGEQMIGQIASAKDHLLINDNLPSHPLIADRDWAKKLGLVSFAGFQLRLHNGDPLGVLALFSRHVIAPEEQTQLNVLSNTVAQVIGSHQAEMALRESEERFRLIARTIDEVFWVYSIEKKRVTYVSPAHERIWGYPVELLYENHLNIFEMIHPEDLELVAATMERMKSGEGFDYEYRIIRPDGSVRHIRDRSFPIRDEDGQVRSFVGVGEDVTAQREAEENLRKSKEYLNQIINCIGDPIFVKDSQYRVVLTNDANCAMLALSKEDIIGSTLQGKVPKEIIDPLIEEEEKIFETGQPSVTVDEVQSADGQRYTVMANKTLLTDANGNKQIVGVIRDISELKKAEEDRANMEIQLRQAHKLEAIGQLAAGIAHEINTPTQYVSDNVHFLKGAFDNFLKVLESYDDALEANQGRSVDAKLIERLKAVRAGTDLEYLEEETPKAISQSIEGLNRIAAIIRAMKEFSYPDLGEKQTIDLNRMIENSLTVCRNEWKYVADVVTDFDAALPPVPCLPGDINQVILNLVINAAHAISDATNNAEKGKGIIGISTRHHGNCVEIRVQDNGTGIPKKYRSKIFTPFFTTKEVGKGTGQGLAICRTAIFHKHGGTLEFETETGKGTTFIVRLPLNSDSMVSKA